MNRGIASVQAIKYFHLSAGSMPLATEPRCAGVLLNARTLTSCFRPSILGCRSRVWILGFAECRQGCDEAGVAVFIS